MVTPSNRDKHNRPHVHPRLVFSLEAREEEVKFQASQFVRVEEDMNIF